MKEITAKLNNYRASPRKTRIVADLIKRQKSERRHRSVGLFGQKVRQSDCKTVEIRHKQR